MACSPSRLLPSSSLHHRCLLSSGPSALWLRNGSKGRWLKRFWSLPRDISPVAAEPSSARHRLRADGRSSSQTRAASSRTGSSAADAASATMSGLEEIDSDRLISSVGIQPTPPVSLKAWNLTDHHLLALSAIACMTGAAVTALFVAAIPTLLAFKKAAESLEKLLDVTQEELPGTMAAVRLSGMEISDLTMELSELGQEISEGVKSSARAVRAAEDGLRRMSNIASVGPNNSSSKGSEARRGIGGKESS